MNMTRERAQRGAVDRAQLEGSAGPTGPADPDLGTSGTEPDRSGPAGTAAPTRRRRAVPLALAGLLLLAVVLVLFDVPNYKAGVGGEPGPQALPLLIGLLSAIAATALVIQTLRGAHEDDDQDVGPVVTKRVLAAIAALVAAALLLEQIGFFVVFTGLTFLTGLFAGAKRWWTALLLGAVATWVVMIVFGQIFAVPLPASPIDVFLGG